MGGASMASAFLVGWGLSHLGVEVALFGMFPSLSRSPYDKYLCIFLVIDLTLQSLVPGLRVEGERPEDLGITKRLASRAEGGIAGIS